MKDTTLCYIEKDGMYLLLHRVKKANDVNHEKWIGVGGHVEAGETPEACVLREVREETGLTLTSYRACGEILFFCAPYPPERMYLYHADGFSGTIGECDEGELVWMPREKMRDLPVWEGDFIFLALMERGVPYFHIQLRYEGDRLAEAVWDGRALPLPDWQSAL